VVSEHEVKVGSWIDLQLAGGILMDYFRGNEQGVMLCHDNDTLQYFNIASMRLLVQLSARLVSCHQIIHKLEVFDEVRSPIHEGAPLLLTSGTNSSKFAKSGSAKRGKWKDLRLDQTEGPKTSSGPRIALNQPSLC
jgi:hypothetical protein